MDKPQSKLQSFIVKVWLEQAGDDRAKNVLHGHVTHVPSGERRYLKRLSDITDFIAPYLVATGVKPGFWSRLARLVRLRKRET